MRALTLVASDNTFGSYRSHRGHISHSSPVLMLPAVAAVVSIRRDEGSRSFWHERAMRSESMSVEGVMLGNGLESNTGPQKRDAAVRFGEGAKDWVWDAGLWARSRMRLRVERAEAQK